MAEDDLDKTEGLVEREPRDTDELVDEIPGVELEEDYAALTSTVTEDRQPSTAQLAAAALTNANLTDTLIKVIAGVDDTGNVDPPNLILADSSDDKDEDEANDGDDEDGILYLGENLAPLAPCNEIDLVQGEEQLDFGNSEDGPHADGNGGNDTGLAVTGEGHGDTEEDDQAFTGKGPGEAEEDDSVESNVAVRVKQRRRKKKKQTTPIDFNN